MESGIFAIIGVIVGAVLTKLEGKEFKLNFSKRKKTKDGAPESEGLTMAKQWENLLNYDGRGN